MNIAQQIQDACVTNEVLSAARGVPVTLSDEAVGWLKSKLSAFTPSDVCKVLGMSIIEAHRLIKRLRGQAVLSPNVCMVKRNGNEWSYAWA